jgi:hypothetical protein
VGINIAFIILAYFLRIFGTTIDIVIILLTATSVIATLYYSRSTQRAIKRHKINGRASIKSHKIITLSPEGFEVNN